MALRPSPSKCLVVAYLKSCSWWRLYSCACSYSSSSSSPSSSSSHDDQDAYQVLGLPRDCTHDSVRAAFRRLAKVAHPDMLADAASPANTTQFVRILAAYQILSDPRRRAYYDEQLGLHHQARSDAYKDSQESLRYETPDNKRRRNSTEGMEVVEWLRKYRIAVADMIYIQELGVGTGLQEELRGGLQFALRKAYFGPQLKVSELFPECFEADERARTEYPDILQLVSGRYLFGSVREEPKLQKLEQRFLQTLSSPHSCPKIGPTGCYTNKDIGDSLTQMDSLAIASEEADKESQAKGLLHIANSNAYANLELMIRGKVIARATRVPLHRGHMSCTSHIVSDCISVYVCSKEAEKYLQEKAVDDLRVAGASENVSLDRPSILIGKITGLRSTDMGRTSTVHSPDGTKTHVILQHKTPFVRHMHWYKLSEDGTECECRCRRARMPPSRFWLFEPRNTSHNIGGWYIERFGHRKDDKWRHSGSQSKHLRPGQHFKANGSDSFGSVAENENSSSVLHPALYIFAVAYKTLDEEVAQRNSQSRVLEKLSNYILWVKQKWSVQSA